MLLKKYCLHYKNEACKACKACLACKKHTNNIGSRNVTMTNRVIRGKSRCGEFLSNKSRFMKQKHNKKVVSSIIKLKC